MSESSEGLQFHARRWNTGHSSTADLERAAVDYAKSVDSSDDVLRRLARLAWIQVGKARNPLLEQVMSGNDRAAHDRFTAWNTTQVELGRALFRVVFQGEPPDLALLRKALDFLGA